VLRERYEVEGFNPCLQEETLATRTLIKQDWDLPLFKSGDGAEFIDELLNLKDQNDRIRKSI
jgi:hypothetical protein